MATDSTVTIGADLSQLRRDLAKLPNLSGEAAQKTLIAVERTVIKAEKAAKASARRIAGANTKAARTTQAAWQNAAQSLTGLGPAAALATTGIAAIPAAAIAAAAGVFKLANGMSAYVDAANRSAATTGVTVAEFLALSHAAGQTGFGVKDIEPGLRKLVGTMQDAQTGTKTAVDAFDSLGVSWANSDGTLRAANDVLADTLDAIGGLASETDRAAAAQEVFGARGAQVVAILGTNSAALRDAQEATAGLAATVESAQEASAKMDAAMAALKLSLDEVRVAAGRDLADAVGGSITILAQLISTWQDFRDATAWVRDTTSWLDPWSLLGKGIEFVDRSLADAEVPVTDLKGAMTGLGEETEYAAAAMDILAAAAKTADIFTAMAQDIIDAESGLSKADRALEKLIETRKAATAQHIADITAQSGITVEESGNIWALYEAWEAVTRAEATAAKGTRSHTKALKEQVDSLDDILASIEPVFDEMNDGLGPIRALTDEVDALIPPEALSDVDRFTLLLLDLELQAASSAEAAAALAEPIERVTAALQDAQGAEFVGPEMPEEFEPPDLDDWLAFADQVMGQIGDIASEIGARAEEALAEVTNQIDDIDGMLEDLRDVGVDAGKLTGDALLEAFREGKVAAKDLSDSQRQMLESRLKAEKAALVAAEEEKRKLAESAFLANQAIAIADATIATALAIMQAYAQLGPVAGSAAAILIGALGATQVALIANQKPSFAAGGFFDDMPTTGGNATLHPDEAVLNKRGRASMGDDAIRAANNGSMVGGGQQRLSMVYKHKSFDYFVRDHLRQDTSLSRAIRGDRRVGHRSRARRT